jgi:hypothetical protein
LLFVFWSCLCCAVRRDRVLSSHLLICFFLAPKDFLRSALSLRAILSRTGARAPSSKSSTWDSQSLRLLGTEPLTLKFSSADRPCPQARAKAIPFSADFSIAVRQPPSARDLVFFHQGTGLSDSVACAHKSRETRSGRSSHSLRLVLPRGFSLNFDSQPYVSCSLLHFFLCGWLQVESRVCY